MRNLIRRSTVAQAGLAALVVLVPLAAAAPFLKADQYGALATAIQSVIVAAAFLVAVLVYQGDSRDRRVDRVLDLHREYSAEDFQSVRRAIVQSVKAGAPPYESLVRADLEESERRAVTRILRYYERVYAAHLRGSLDERLAAKLLGAHAVWWDLAVDLDEGGARQPLHLFADWCNSYVDKHADDELFAGWGTTRMRDFGKKGRAR